MPTKQGYTYIMAHIRLFLFIKGIIEFLTATIVFIKLKKLNFTSA
jgi:hypothetical protein